MNKKSVLAGIFMLAGMAVFAQQNDSIKKLEDVVVSDSKFALPKEKSGKVIVKISAEDLKKKQGQTVASVLSTVAGLEINGNQSRNGKDLGLFIRGGRNHQVLILIDGVPVTDASGINLSYDLRLLPVDQVESIEVMKGAASTLYGTGAGTGVINITLKKATSEKVSGNYYMNLGTQSTVANKNYGLDEMNHGVSFSRKGEKMNFFASLSSVESGGMSEAKPEDKNTVFEDDRFSRINSMVKLGFTPTQKLSLDFFANYDGMRNEFDSGPFSDDSSNYSKSKQYRVGFSPKYKYNKGELVINSGANVISRNFFNFNTMTYYKSKSANVDMFNKYEILSDLFVVAGGQFQFHEMSNESDYGSIAKELANFNMIDPYATLVYTTNFGLNVNAGARYNIHSRYGNNFVYNFNPSYAFKTIPLKVLTSYSTAFVSPSLYQLYSPYGDLQLSPEKDATAEAGFEVSLLSKKITVSTVAFHREEKEAIGFDLMTYKYFNVTGKNIAKGVESMISYDFNDKIKFTGNYTFTELQRQSRMLNPKHKVNASLDVQPTSRLAFNVAYQFVSARLFEYTVYLPPTWDPVLIQEKLNDYQLVNANVRYQLVKNKMTIFGAVDNILDRDYVEARGYSTRGRNFKVGFNFLF